ncbi:hypothetical protein AMATHDRAFT_45819 [Amanita thiersii Skay4041]|uniref:RecA family profile 1 domain-containing protein n=1 Tax=Amanita thiersii Skay4041 TaxID=703135 RepID=A0A2A9NYH9_9AGAR|nr:hypothetical protein AMATHDRAFT_45819 [Amanita thiersii Skay4041]
MRLAALSLFPEDVISSLETCGIRTDTDLLFLKKPHEIYGLLPFGLISFEQLLDCIAAVAEKASTPGISAAHLLFEQIDRPTVVPVIDKLLGGESGSMIEVSGEHATGKTTLAFNAVLKHLIEHEDSSAIWFDTSGRFSVFSTPQVLSSDQAVIAALERLRVCLAFDIHGIQVVLDAIPCSPLVRPLGLDEAANSGNLSQTRPTSDNLTATGPSFVVIDTVTPLLGPNLSSVSSQGHSLMVNFMRYLREIAIHRRLVILVLNDTTFLTPRKHGASEAVKKPCLGPSFAYMSDSLIWLSRSSCSQHSSNESAQQTMITAEITRSRTMSRKRVTFQLQNGYIYE